MAKINYTFGGWYKEAAHTNQWNFANDTVTSDITIYAKWTLNQYTVTFNVNGATGGTAPAAQSADYNTNITLPSGSGLTRIGYIFGGWNTDTAGTGTNYNADSSYTVTGNITLYAKWTLNQYTVTFNANGATGGTTPAALTADHNTSITLPSGDVMARTGYTFGGWNTNTAGTGTNYNANSSYTVTGSITLYAKWTLNQYTVTFNANGATGGTAPAEQTADYNTSITLPSGSGLTRTGYTFGGWNISTAGTGTNYNEESSYTVTGNITLYAKWTLNQYTVTYNTNGATSGTAPAARTANYNINITLPNGNGLAKTNYTFDGWNTNADGTGTNYNANSSYTVTGNITLYARWIPIKYTVTFNANGATSGTAPAAQTADYNTSITLPSGSGLTRTGYTFGGWNINTAGTGTNYNANSPYTVTGNITLYAKWNFALPLTDVSLIKPYLDAQTDGTSVNNPVSLPVQIALGNMTQTGSGWRRLLETIATAGKYVNLDLSACTMDGTEFNPDYNSSTGKNRIVDIVLPDTAVSIASGNITNEIGTFRNFTVLKSFSGAGLTSIGDWAFYNCTSLALTSLPAGITSIGYWAFYNCTSLALTSLPANLNSISPSAFRNCTSLALTSLPAGITSIEQSVFYNCTSLTQISLPAGLTNIDDRAFSLCTGLTQISLPAGVNSIDFDAFIGCTNLALVTCLAQTPPTLGARVFQDTHASLVIKVPAARVTAYKTANRWSEYADKISAIQ
jgi:uncharacterized repeat protein (TIGR02543 family)